MTNGFEHLMEMCDAGTSFNSESATSAHDVDRRVVLLYGGGNDTGIVATKQFLETGADVVIADEPAHRRSVSREIGDGVMFLDLDPQNLQSIEDAAERFKASYDDLDVLASTKSVACAAAGQDEGSDRTYAVNHLALYYLYYHFEDMMYRCRTLVPIHPVVNDVDASDANASDGTEGAFIRSQYANAALVVGIHIQRWDRTINGYDPGIVVHDEEVSETDRISTPSDPEAGADRLVHVSSAGTAGILRGGYYQDSVEDISEILEKFEDKFYLWDVSTPEFHKLPLSQEEAESVLRRDATLCDLDPDWYKTDAWWLDADRGPVGY